MTAPDSKPRLFCFGLGYSAGRLARRLKARDWAVAGTCQSPDRQAELADWGIEALVFDPERPLADAPSALSGVTHLLSSVPPGENGDPVLARHGSDIEAMEGVSWVGYLSSTGVYGDTGGKSVTEDSAVNPSSDHGRRRAEAEAAWLALENDQGLPVHVFRLAGIYGPGRSALDQVRAGRAKRIDKPGHMFSRIHIDDIAQVLRASMDRPNPGAVYNVCDDEPAAAADVTAFACELLGLEPPPLQPFAEAEKEMSEMALSFWRDNRLVNNRRIKEELGVSLLHPDYRAGLRAIFEEG
ncbi:MAG: SDR family oxidoreductase [Proteobacteria bacterium]|nr:SDR family oxidoreductase [Pseudomonadota bacterium]